VPLSHPAPFTTGSSLSGLGSGRRLSRGSHDVVDNATLTSPQAGSDPRIDKEVPVTTRRHTRVAGTLFALVAVVAAAIPGAVAQDATPVAQLVAPARPAHIHSGNCVELGDVVVPLADLTAPVGDRVGQADRATPAESSYTNVPMTLDAILGVDHAINVHLSAERIDTYIACGELGGDVDASGALVVGLREESDSGYTGIAFLSPGADGASTDVSVFIAPVFGAAG
jgi:hypothetical protein